MASTEDTVTVEWAHSYVSGVTGRVITLPATDQATAERDAAQYDETYGRMAGFVPAEVVCRTATVTPWGPPPRPQGREYGGVAQPCEECGRLTSMREPMPDSDAYVWRCTDHTRYP